MLIDPSAIDEYLQGFYYDCAAAFQQWSLRHPFRIADFILSGATNALLYNTVPIRRSQLFYLLKLFMYPEDLARILVDSYSGTPYARIA